MLPKHSDEAEYVKYLIKSGNFFLVETTDFKLRETIQTIYCFKKANVEIRFMNEKLFYVSKDFVDLFYKSSIYEIYLLELPLSSNSRYHTRTFEKLNKQDAILLEEDISEWCEEINTLIYFQKWLTNEEVVYIVDHNKTKWLKGK